MIFKVSKMYVDHQEDRKIFSRNHVINFGNLTKLRRQKSVFYGYTDISINTALLFLTKKKKTDNASFTENLDVQDENSDEKKTQLEFFIKQFMNSIP